MNPLHPTFAAELDRVIAQFPATNPHILAEELRRAAERIDRDSMLQQSQTCGYIPALKQM